jgi:hypothetical protein
MTLGTLLAIIIILCVIIWGTGYLPAPFNPWLRYIAVGAVVIVLIFVLFSLLGLGNIGFNTPIGHK